MPKPRDKQPSRTSRPTRSRRPAPGKAPGTPKHRSPCPLSCPSHPLGDKWTLLIVRHLFAGRQLFAEFARSPERIASNIQADRLQRLQGAGLIEARDNHARQGSHSYHLTERGQSLWPLLVALRDWGLAQLPGTVAKVAVPAPASSKPTPATRA